MKTPLVAGGIAILVAYVTGLGGPFVLDDHVTLLPIWQWLAGAEFAHVFSNPSGPSGRWLAMASFAANALVGGQSAIGFKLVNLLLHVANAALAWRVLSRLPPHTAMGAGTALAIALLWALHPQHVSTVLYVSQRMALLGATAQLGAVLLYLEARQALAAGQTTHARRLLYFAFPLVVVLGLFGKETALLAVPLCAALEFALWRRSTRTREIRAFFLFFLAFPAVAIAAFLVAQPDWLASRYAGREFTLAERLLTQPRVLADYAAGWIFPLPQLQSLYRDGYVHSTGWFAPPATLVAWVGALIVLAFALATRRAIVSAGILWFFAAHAMESTVIPLEPYFEHRNYVASLGLAMLLVPVARLRPARSLFVACALLLAIATAWRSWQWLDFDRLLATEGPAAGEISRRLEVDRAIRAFELRDDEALSAALGRLQSGNAGDRSAAALWRVVLACERDGRIDAAARDALGENLPLRVTHGHVSWLGLLADRAVRSPGCEGLGRDDVARLVEDFRRRTADNPWARARLDAIARRLAGEGITQ